jgi:hypothetical protein
VILPPADLPRELLAWRIGDRGGLFDGAVDVLATPEVEVFRGRRCIVLRVHDVRPAEGERA